MILSGNWIIVQVTLSAVSAILHVVLFYFMTVKKKDAHFEAHWRQLGVSLVFSHFLSSICLMLTGITNTVAENLLGAHHVMCRVEDYILIVSLLCTMLHNLSIMVSDCTFTCPQKILPEENLFYVVLSWISTLLFTVVLPFLGANDKVSKCCCIVVLLTDILLVIVYTEICRRNCQAIRRKNEFGHEYFVERFPTDGNRQFMYLGIALSASFVVFNIPFSLEQLFWQSNGVLSYMCVTLISILHGLLCGARLWLIK